MKRILSLLLCLVLLVSLAACGDNGTDTATGGSQTSSDPKTDTSGGSDKTSDETEKTEGGFDEDMEHKFIATDITNHSIVVYDLNKCEGDWDLLTNDSLAIVWEWDSDDDPNCKIKPGKGIDAAKYRYSAYYERDVMIACSSGGWAGVVDYEAKSLLWEFNFGSGPHSIEMMPNGDVVVGISGDPGGVAYVPLSAGETKPSSKIDSLYCHGVSYDPVNDWLWVLEDTGVYAATVSNYGTANAKLSRVGGMDFRFGNGIAGGHAFSPVYGEPGCYWASSADKLWKFDSNEETITKSFSRSSALTTKANIKGIASFPDGTVVQTVANLNGKATAAWASDGFRIITREWSKGKVPVLNDVVKIVVFDPADREFYKVQPFTKDYQ